jgi:glucan phosphorylase
MSMDKPSFARKSAPAKANHTDGGDLSTRPATAPAEDDDVDEIKSAVLAKLALELGKDASAATDRDWFVAAALTIRDRIVHRWLTVDRASHAQGRKRVYYLSLEFLIGRLFADVLCNLGWTEIFRAALGDLGVDLNRLRAAEPDAALGHGGLGRLAACFMESMATLGIPAYGYGIRYDHGLFRQVIRDGWQAVLRQSMGVRSTGSDLRYPLRRLGRDDDFADRRQTLGLAPGRDPRGGCL